MGCYIFNVTILKYFPISALSWCGQDRECLVSKVTITQPKASGGTLHLAWPPPATSGKGAGILLGSGLQPGLMGA